MCLIAATLRHAHILFSYEHSFTSYHVSKRQEHYYIFGVQQIGDLAVPRYLNPALPGEADTERQSSHGSQISNI